MKLFRVGFREYFMDKYSRFASRCKDKNNKAYYGLPFMSRDDYNEFLERTYMERRRLHTIWVVNDFARKYSPSIDRIDPSKGYTPSNCRWISHSENASLSVRNKTTCKRGHPWTKENIYIYPKTKNKNCLTCARFRNSKEYKRGKSE